MGSILMRARGNTQVYSRRPPFYGLFILCGFLYVVLSQSLDAQPYGHDAADGRNVRLGQP